MTSVAFPSVLAIALLLGTASCSPETIAPVADAGTIACQGKAFACTELIYEEVACRRAGCTASYRCVGTPSPCAAIFSSGPCGRQNGCSWDFLTHRCEGNGPHTCTSAATSAAVCERFEGCTWKLGCEGETAACADRSVVSCPLNGGCQVVDTRDAGGPTNQESW